MVSSSAGERLSPRASLHFEMQPDFQGATLRVNEKVDFQTSVGFGASFLEAGMICLNSHQQPESPGQCATRLAESLSGFKAFLLSPSPRVCGGLTSQGLRLWPR